MSSSSSLPPSLFFFLLSLLFPLLLFSSSTPTAYMPFPSGPKCVHQHLSALLQLKHGFNLTLSSTNLSTWNENNPDCCHWEGITCNSFTGHLIGLNLSGLEIDGLLNFQSLFQLGSLQRLDLSDNYFHGSHIPSGFARLSNLTHLHLRWNHFYGQIPLDIFHLTRLVSLDLSYNYYYNGSIDEIAYGLNLESSSSGMEQLFRNLSGLRELFLDQSNLSTMGSQWGRILSYALPNLHTLSLSECSLSGPIHPSLSRLHLLTLLDLSSNHLSSPVPEFLSNLTSLTSLNLWNCYLHHIFPTSFFSLPKLKSLYISENQFLRIYFPEFPMNSTIQQLAMSGTELHATLADFPRNFKSLTSLGISGCNLSGPIPQSYANLSRLVNLDLSGNNIQGSIPPLIFTLTELQYLQLSSNHFSGVVDLGSFQNLKKLKSLHLSYNNFSAIVNTGNSSASFAELDLSSNNFQGPIPRVIFELTQLQYLLLSSNHFSDVVDLVSFQNLKKLRWLDLSYNNFSGVVDLSLLQNLKNLTSLGLSDNSLTVVDLGSSSISTSFPHLSSLYLRSCNLSKVPTMLRNQEEMQILDLSRNRIHGKIPQWIWKAGMYFLNLSNNALEGLEGPFPHTSLTLMTYLDLSNNLLRGSTVIPPPSSSFFSLANNSLDGEVPSVICEAKWLEVLDLSNNNFTGLIPRCLGETRNGIFKVLNLGKNAFHGPLLQKFEVECTLETLDLSGNKLEGQMPKSLANCQKLTVLNLGENQIQDEFPSQLGNLSNLHVLVLRSNKFFGSIGQPWTSQKFFPQLQIIDLSFNNFSGRLPPNLFSAWQMMIDGGSASEFLAPNISGTYYHDKVFLVWKGIEIEFVKILVARTVIDLSHNQFKGDIPTCLGELKALHSLNLSHNHFQGEIPASIQNLKDLESLDLSDNSLSGKIPWQLTELSFLGVLNLSQNQLIGRIPQGRHFDTFGSDSFLGNSGLCGQPLSRKCEEDDEAATAPATGSEEKSEMELMWMGFGVGHAVGFGMFFWTLALWRRGRRTFLLFVDRVLFPYFSSGLELCMRVRLSICDSFWSFY